MSNETPPFFAGEPVLKLGRSTLGECDYGDLEAAAFADIAPAELSGLLNVSAISFTASGTFAHSYAYSETGQHYEGGSECSFAFSTTINRALESTDWSFEAEIGLSFEAGCRTFCGSFGHTDGSAGAVTIDPVAVEADYTSETESTYTEVAECPSCPPDDSSVSDSQTVEIAMFDGGTCLVSFCRDSDTENVRVAIFIQVQISTEIGFVGAPVVFRGAIHTGDWSFWEDYFSLTHDPDTEEFHTASGGDLFGAPVVLSGYRTKSRTDSDSESSGSGCELESSAWEETHTVTADVTLAGLTVHFA